MQACGAFTIQSYVMTNGQSASLSWCRVTSGIQDQIFVALKQLRICLCWVSLS
jgi:hypothetical protein